MVFFRPLAVSLALPLYILCSANPTPTSPIIDLGYARYRGSTNTTSGYDTFFGMRFAAPPVGNLRFRAPQPPPTTSVVVDASNNGIPGTVCPQGLVPGLMNIENQKAINVSEDCLTLTVYAPTYRTAYKKLQVIVYLHGGGYTMGDHQYEHPPRFLDLADEDVVVVVPNYRLGLFGFLAGEDVLKDGTLNAGLLDQQYALLWVKKHITKFGGDPEQVTIWGQSAGGGAVIQNIISNPSYPNNQNLFHKAVANSPFSPSQYYYNDKIPSQLYRTVLQKTGCSSLSCLRSLPQSVLVLANLEIANAGFYGTLTWAPVIEPKGGFIDTRPTVALFEGSRNLKARKVLTTHTSWEGQVLGDPSITSANITKYIRGLHPSLSDSQVNQALNLYPLSDYDSEFRRTQSIQQDTVFLCPSYWLATAFCSKSYKGVWDVNPAAHGQDLGYFFHPGNYNTLPSPETFENYVGGIMSFIRSGLTADPNVYRLNSGSGQSNAAVWPLWSPQKKEQVFTLGKDGVSSVVFTRTMSAGQVERCNWWKSVGATTGQ